MNTQIDIEEIVTLSKQLCFEIEVALATQSYGVDLEEEWNQKGPRLMVRFLTEQVANENFDVRKTALIQNTQRFKSWLGQCHYEYQKKWPNHINEVGGSVPARRVGMYKHCDDFIALCKKDVHEVMGLYDLVLLSTEQAKTIVEQPIESIVFDEKNPDHMVFVEANRKAGFNGGSQNSQTEYEQKRVGNGVGIKM